SWGRFGRAIGRRCRGATAFVAISREIEDELREAWATGTMRALRTDATHPPRPAWPRIVSIPNGVPIPPSPQQRRPDWRAAPRAAFVGRLAPEKGLDTLLDAWPAVQEAHPGARLILIGEGPERPALEARARALGLSVGPGRAVELPGVAADPVAALPGADLLG